MEGTCWSAQGRALVAAFATRLVGCPSWNEDGFACKEVKAGTSRGGRKSVEVKHTTKHRQGGREALTGHLVDPGAGDVTLIPKTLTVVRGEVELRFLKGVVHRPFVLGGAEVPGGRTERRSARSWVTTPSRTASLTFG